METSALPDDRWERYKLLSATAVCGASLAAFRFALGVVMALEAYFLCRPYTTAISTGPTPLATYYTGADIHFHFPYDGFGWLPVLPPHGIYAVVGVLALASVCVALGLFYRLAAVALFSAWGYLFAIEATRTYWQNAPYLELLLTFLLMWMPAARRLSIDAWWTGRRRGTPRTVPYWTVVLLRGQLVIMYFFGGVSKLNADWLRDAVPIRWFVARVADAPPFGAHLSAAHLELVQRFLRSDGLAHFMGVAGAAFDLSIGFLLLARRTRFFGLVLLLFFHLTNHLMFDDIGLFPLLGILTALIFLPPDWPDQLWKWLKRPRISRPDWAWLAGGAVAIPIVGAALGWKAKADVTTAATDDDTGSTSRPALAASVTLFWLAWQAFMPVRHLLIPGDARITHEGLTFSWRLKTEARGIIAARLYVRDETIIRQGPGGRVNWSQWHGEKVMYRTLSPGSINWHALPAIMVVLDPLLGERVIYNPLAGPTPVRTETLAREEARLAWRELYGREPRSLTAARPLSDVVDLVSAALRNAGHAQDAAAISPQVLPTEQTGAIPGRSTPSQVRAEFRTFLSELAARGGGGGDDDVRRLVRQSCRSMAPFALDGDDEQVSVAPFLVIDDPLVVAGAVERPAKVDRAVWRSGSPTRGIARTPPPSDAPDGIEPLVVYWTKIALESKDVLPDAFIFDTQNHPEAPPEILWNCARDLTLSESLHVSGQPFLLRRYACRVADLWEQQYGRRPAVEAITAVSLNGRPHQRLVDPRADLARVRARWFGHNNWILDLQTPKIPASSLNAKDRI